jgi:hypothetical protein
VDDRILILASSGTLNVIEATPEAYRELGSIQAADTPTYAHLVAVASRLYVRDARQIQCFDFGHSDS